MAQQINLHRPILLKPRLLFSAKAIAQSVAIFSVAVVAACVWVSLSVKAFKQNSQGTEQRLTQERDQLLSVLTPRSASDTDVKALQQQLTAMQVALNQQRLSLNDMYLGRNIGDRSYSAILKLLADTVPPPVWITDVIVSTARLEVTGMTLDPAALQAWSVRLATHPLLQGQRLAAVRVERAPATPLGPGAAIAREAWAFTLVTDGATQEAKQ
jgi:Tfp pilus assembly protein PilN